MNDDMGPELDDLWWEAKSSAYCTLWPTIVYDRHFSERHSKSGEIDFHHVTRIDSQMEKVPNG